MMMMIIIPIFVSTTFAKEYGIGTFEDNKKIMNRIHKIS
jgi:hypothetical protein